MNLDPDDILVVPGARAALFMEQRQPTEHPETILRRREIEKLDFPAWVKDPKDDSRKVVSPIVASFYRALVGEDLGVGLEDLPKLVEVLPRVKATMQVDGAPITAKVHHGRELKRLLILADHVVRKFLANATGFVGGAAQARTLRDLAPLTTVPGLVAADAALKGIAQGSAAGIRSEEDGTPRVNEEQFVLINAITFAGTYVAALLALLRQMQESLVSQGEGAERPEVPRGYTLQSTAPTTPPKGDVMEVSGVMVHDLVQYAFSVYGAARVLAEQSLGGRGARAEVDRMGIACLVEMVDAVSLRRR